MREKSGLCYGCFRFDPMRRECTEDKAIDTRNVKTCGDFLGLVEQDQTADDAVSRKAAIDAVAIDNLHPGIVRALQSILAELPPVTPKQRTGHWTYLFNSWVNGLKVCECDACKKRAYGSTHFCPNCGAKMEVDG